ncbi:MAG: hypothetical protein M1833_002611 [Piccolia ochrophora]|nr:MAG: hypothetical protein M1833_002611 [Piccolia ochrophora]
MTDLQAFQASHFPPSPTPHQTLANSNIDYESSLGTYPDGTPRTLTDDQIAMFRHSEIHALRRARARAADAADSSGTSPEAEKDGHTATGGRGGGGGAADGQSHQEPYSDDEDAEEDDEAAYAAFLAEERQRLDNEKSEGVLDYGDEQASALTPNTAVADATTRRKVVVYDSDDEGNDDADTQRGKMRAREPDRRAFQWPVIGSG